MIYVDDQVKHEMVVFCIAMIKQYKDDPVKVVQFADLLDKYYLSRCEALE